tara:strand:+ start:18204 stop:18395 length:192 start_codon:yes stop_codon:yes gene_type:complete
MSFVTTDLRLHDMEWAVISSRFVTNDEEFHYMWQCEDEVDSPPWKFCNHWLGFNGYLINLGEI